MVLWGLCRELGNVWLCWSWKYLLLCSPWMDICFDVGICLVMLRYFISPYGK